MQGDCPGMFQFQDFWIGREKKNGLQNKNDHLDLNESKTALRWNDDN